MEVSQIDMRREIERGKEKVWEKENGYDEKKNSFLLYLFGKWGEKKKNLFSIVWYLRKKIKGYKIILF